MDGHIEENNGNKYLVFDSTDENKEVLKSTQNFGMGLKMKLKQKMVAKKINMVKILWKSNLIQMKICH